MDTTARFVIPGEKIEAAQNVDGDLRIEVSCVRVGAGDVAFLDGALPAEAASDFFSLTRAYFLRESTPTGVVLKPLSDGASDRVW